MKHPKLRTNMLTPELGSPNAKTVIQRSYGIEWMICDICVLYMKYVMCCVQYEKNDNAFYSHIMTFLIWFGKFN